MQTFLQTTNAPKSLAFYRALDFGGLLKQASGWVSDGKAILFINPGRYARPGILVYAEQPDTLVSKLPNTTSVLKTEEEIALCSPSGVWVHLQSTKKLPEIKLPKVPSLLGNFAGISVETVSLDKSIAFWECFGFSIYSGSVQSGWVSLQNAFKNQLSLMQAGNCPHLFPNPSLTYFNGNENLSVIEKIKALDIPIAEEVTVFNSEGIVDNVVLKDPGGLGVFVFND